MTLSRFAVITQPPTHLLRGFEQPFGCLMMILNKIAKVDKMEVSKQFPMMKEQLLYKLEGIALHQERRLEESALVLASQVLV